MLDPASFRLAFSAFADATNAEVNAAIALATNADDPYLDDSWGGRFDRGLGLFICHYIVLARNDKMVVDANDVIARHTQNLNIARSAEEVKAQRRDPLLRTTFGQEFRYLARRVGTGMLAI